MHGKAITLDGNLSSLFLGATTKPNQNLFTLHFSEEYLLADKDMSIIPVAFSLMASFMSAISLMGLTREIYMYGTQFLIINFSYLVCKNFIFKLLRALGRRVGNYCFIGGHL